MPPKCYSDTWGEGVGGVGEGVEESVTKHTAKHLNKKCISIKQTNLLADVCWGNFVIGIYLDNQAVLSFIVLFCAPLLPMFASYMPIIHVV